MWIIVVPAVSRAGPPEDESESPSGVVGRVLEGLTSLDAALNTLLDRPVADSVGPLAMPAETVVLPPVGELQRLALDQQPDLKAADLEVSRAEAALGVVRSEYRPDFSVMGGYMLMPGQRDSWMAKVAITWPNAPWAKPRVDAKAAEATASMAAARARRDAVVSATREAVYTAMCGHRLRRGGRRYSAPPSCRSRSRRWRSLESGIRPTRWISLS